MTRLNELQEYRRYLEKRYHKLIERANNYKYEDECKSDRSAFKAMRVLEKLNRVRYLDDDFSNSAV